jgi:hypothetical protein
MGRGKAWSHNAVHDEPARNVFQFFGHILTEAAQSTTALGAILVASRQFHFHARDVIWDRAALGFVLWLFVGETQLCCHLGDGYLAGLQCQLKLLDAL